MLESLILQTINYFTCSLTNHNAWWLNIYCDRMLYLANTEYVDMCAVSVSVHAY